MKHMIHLLTCLILVGVTAGSLAADTIGDFDDGLGAWHFGRGSEYPGAQGEAVKDGDAHGGAAALKITGDFTGGGRYVHVERKLDPPVDAGPVELWVKSSDVRYLLVRLVDETGQTFQPQLPLRDEAGWQKLTIGKLNSGQKWGGANDGQWHGKLKAVSVLLEKGAIRQGARGALLLDDVTVGAAGEAGPSAPAPSSSPSPTPDGGATRSLHDGVESDGGWEFGLGGEFAGAGGSMERTNLASHEGDWSLKLAGDFNGGGRFVEAVRKLAQPVDADRFSVWVRPRDLKFILVRLVDSSGQTHQHQKPVEPTDTWQEVTIDNFRSRTKWGGKNDGEFHGPVTSVSILLERPAITNGELATWMHIDDLRLTHSADQGAAAIHRLTAPLGFFAHGTSGWWPLLDDKSTYELNIEPKATDGGALRADIDFGRGTWFTLNRQFDQPFDIESLRFGIKADNVKEVSVSLTSTTGQDIQRKITIERPGQWQTVEVKDLPAGKEPIQRNHKSLYGAQVSIRLHVSRDSLRDAQHTSATVWLAQPEVVAVGDGVLHNPGSTIRAGGGLIARIDTRPMAIYWGPGATIDPTRVRFDNVTDEPIELPAVTLVDHRYRPVAVLMEGGKRLGPGKTHEAEFDVELPAFGHYSIETWVAGEPLRAGLAWVREEGQPEKDGPFGIHLHLSQGPWGKAQSVGGGASQLELVRKIGAGWVREDLHVSWGEDDRITDDRRSGFFAWADAAKANGLSVIATYFDYGPGDGKPPATDAERARYAKRFAALVERFSDVTNVFEVWNEPNIAPGWRGRDVDAAQYTAMLAEAYKAIKRANPNAYVLGVTSAGTDFNYVRKAVEAGAAKHMDGISVHPYHYMVGPEESTDQQAPVWAGTGGNVTFVDRMKIIHETLAKHGAPDMQVWGTEMGSGNRDWQHEWLQAIRPVRQYLLGMSLPYVRAQVTYNFQDQGYPEDPQSHMTYGLVRADGAPKQRLVIYNTLARTMRGMRFVEQVDLGEGVFAYRYAGDRGAVATDVLAMWSVEEGRTASFSTSSPSVTLVDLMGNTREVRPIDGRVTLAATGEVRFVLGAGSVSRAEPLLQAQTVARATSEDLVTVRLTRDPALPQDAEVTGDAGRGWTLQSAGRDAVTFQADDELASGRHVLTVCVGDMSAAVDLQIDNAVALLARAEADGGLRVTLNNPFPRERRVRVRPAAPGRSLSPIELTLPAGGEGSTLIAMDTKAAAGWTTVPVSLNAALIDEGSGYIQMPESGVATTGFTRWQANVTPRIDGDLSDWRQAEPHVLDQPHQAVPVGRFAKPNWQGPSDLSAKFHVGSDSTALHLAIEVKDNAHVQEFRIHELWMGDCVQFAFAIEGVRHEVTVAVAEDGRVLAHQSAPVSRELSGFRGVGDRGGDGWRLELSMPWRLLGVADPPAAPEGFALLVNDNDRLDNSTLRGRRGYLQWFGGIGDRKDPAQYAPVRIVP